MSTEEKLDKLVAEVIKLRNDQLFMLNDLDKIRKKLDEVTTALKAMDELMKDQGRQRELKIERLS